MSKITAESEPTKYEKCAVNCGRSLTRAFTQRFGIVPCGNKFNICQECHEAIQHYQGIEQRLLSLCKCDMCKP